MFVIIGFIVFGLIKYFIYQDYFTVYLVTGLIIGVVLIIVGKVINQLSDEKFKH
ncbi:MULTISPECIES: hypothetical protein [Mammaliicoccus]|uniref:hypothetical protein n=1 Tax=Mammaliicoccus TaxID=2803850 RepID=UPI001304E8F0|nr:MULTISPECIES: hypothetical protein [Mammaliicoccus]